MKAVAMVSRKIPTPRPSFSEERETAILLLLSPLYERLVGAYGKNPESPPVNPELQLNEGVYRFSRWWILCTVTRRTHDEDGYGGATPSKRPKERREKSKFGV